MCFVVMDSSLYVLWAAASRSLSFFYPIVSNDFFPDDAREGAEVYFT
jgi:hypothetical protein